MYKLTVFCMTSIIISLVSAECEIFVADYQVKCKNMELGQEEALECPENVTCNTISHLTIENVDGVIDAKTLENYPKLQGLTILSSKIKNGYTIKNLPRINSIEFQNCELPTITRQFLINCCSRVSALEFTGNRSLEIEVGALKSLQKLKELKIDEYKTIDETLFEGLHSLEKLFLVRVDLKHITKAMMRDMTQLTSLTIIKSNVEEIDENTFDNNPKIIFFWMSANKLSEIKPKTFKNLKNLNFLNLMGNDLKFFSLDILSAQKKLTTLRLDTKIMLKVKPSEVKKALPKLRKIGLCLKDRFDPDVSSFVGKLNVCVTWRDEEDNYVKIGADEDCS